MARPSRGSVGRRGFLEEGRRRRCRDCVGTGGRLTRPNRINKAESRSPAPRGRSNTTDRPGSDLHGGRHQVARHRIRRGEPGIEFSRTPRVDHQLRWQPDAGADHVLPRRVVGRDGARLRQDRRQADDGHGARHCRPAARVDGDLQRVLRSCAGLRGFGNILDVAIGAQRVEWVHSVQDAPLMVRDYIKWDDAPVTLEAFRRIGCARVPDRDDAPA